MNLDLQYGFLFHSEVDRNLVDYHMMHHTSGSIPCSYDRIQFSSDDIAAIEKVLISNLGKPRRQDIHREHVLHTSVDEFGFHVDGLSMRQRKRNQMTKFINFDDAITCRIDVSTSDTTKDASVRFVYHGDTPARIEKITKTVGEITDRFPSVPKSNTEFQMIGQTESGFEMSDFKIKESVEDILDYYHPDFYPVSDHIVKTLNKTGGKGIVLLHGDYGTGKTTYLKYLMSQITSKRVIYLPPNLATSLTEPGFITFLSQYPDSVLLIEDAENILQTREAGGNQAVSNILNLSDGIIGDALSFQIIATFNAQDAHIDQALKRPGRLIAEYRFRPLPRHLAQVLANKIHKTEVILPEGSEFTLSDIVTLDQTHHIVKDNKRSVGFI